jgi:hypothetical protein
VADFQHFVDTGRWQTASISYGQMRYFDENSGTWKDLTASNWGGPNSEAPGAGSDFEYVAAKLSGRDKAYLDKYYDAVSKLAKQYKVNPALVLGVGIESGFASKGTYLRTGDAFGMTGGSTSNMTEASSPADNVAQFFKIWGGQIRGAGDNITTFLNGLEGQNPAGDAVKGWRVYNSATSDWRDFITGGIHQMQRDIPLYFALRPPDPVRL